MGGGSFSSSQVWYPRLRLEVNHVARAAAVGAPPALPGRTSRLEERQRPHQIKGAAVFGIAVSGWRDRGGNFNTPESAVQPAVIHLYAVNARALELGVPHQHTSCPGQPPR